MIVEVSVKTSAKNSFIQKKENIYHVSIKSKAVNNAANLELIDILSKYFNVSKSSVKILRGIKSKRKLIEILEDES